MQRGILVAKRIRWAPLPLHTKATLLASLVGPAAMYGFSAGGFQASLINSLRVAVTNALWGHKRRGRCREIVMTLFAKGHLVDPMQVAGYQCLRQLRRLAQTRPEMLCELNAVWRAYADGHRSQGGPVAVIHKTLQWMGWEWQSPTSFARPDRPALCLTQGPDSWWSHEIRHGMRMAEWKRAASRRADMQGIDCLAGIDRTATLAVLNSKKGHTDAKEFLTGINVRLLIDSKTTVRAGQGSIPHVPALQS